VNLARPDIAPCSEEALDWLSCRIAAMVSIQKDRRHGRRRRRRCPLHCAILEAVLDPTSAVQGDEMVGEAS